uniref:Uncharacterized protein n=1 Tax=Setaria italica TaxID=4555 RepID=K4A2T4_SETIT
MATSNYEHVEEEDTWPPGSLSHRAAVPGKRSHEAVRSGRGRRARPAGRGRWVRDRRAEKCPCRRPRGKREHARSRLEPSGAEFVLN